MNGLKNEDKEYGVSYDHSYVLVEKHNCSKKDPTRYHLMKMILNKEENRQYTKKYKFIE